MTERDFQRKVTDLCDYLGLFWYHNPDSRRSNAGFPDLVILGDHHLIFAELKTDRGKVTVEQARWMIRMERAGEVAFVWRPAQWPTIEAYLKSMARGKVRV